jgi:hypothetical protein
MGHSNINWDAIEINDYEFNPKVDRINLSSTKAIESAEELKSKYPEIFNVLFTEIRPSELKINIPFSGYLGTDSYSSEDQILKSFFDNNDSPIPTHMHCEKNKPIYLSRKVLDLNIYKLFSHIISDVNDCDADSGWLSLVSGTCLVSDGEQRWDLTILIDKEGGCWY